MYATAGGGPAHAFLAAMMIVRLYGCLEGKGCRIAGSDLRVQVAPSGPYYYPDVSVVCGDVRTPDAFNDNLLNPVLIVEVYLPQPKFSTGRREIRKL